jgi:hypothetical protein
MTNRDWLNSLGMTDMLHLISERLGGCFVYRMNNRNFDSVDGRCEKYEYNCYNCIADWVNEKENQHGNNSRTD